MALAFVLVLTVSFVASEEQCSIDLQNGSCGGEEAVEAFTPPSKALEDFEITGSEFEALLGGGKGLCVCVSVSVCVCAYVYVSLSLCVCAISQE